MLDDRWAFNIKHCTTFLFRILPLLFSTFSPICIMTLKIVFKRKLFHIEMKIVSHRDDAKIRISSPLPVSILAILSKYSLTPFLCIFSTKYHIQDAAISWSNAFMTNPFLSWKYVTHTHTGYFSVQVTPVISNVPTSQTKLSHFIPKIDSNHTSIC